LNELLPKQQDYVKSELNTFMEQLRQIKDPHKIEAFIETLETKLNKTLQDTNDKMIRSESQMEHGFKEIRDLTNMNQQNVSSLLSKMENSSSKGKLSENILFHILQTLYPSASIDSVGTQKKRAM